MPTRSATRRISRLAGIAAMLGGLPAAGQESDVFTLEISGTRPMAFAGECVVKGDGGDRRIALSGVTPMQRRLSGAGLICTFRPAGEEGALQVLVRGGGALTRSSARGSNSRIVIRLD